MSGTRRDEATPLRPRAARIALIAGIVGLVLCAIGLMVDPRRLAASYLAAHITVLTTALGALIFVMIEHTIGAKWFVVLRRVAESAAMALPALAVLFVPVLVAPGAFYSWAGPLDALDAGVRTRVLAKQAYLNIPFFDVRAVVYFATWLAFAIALWRLSLRQDGARGTEAALAIGRRMRAVSAGGLVAVGLTLTFAAFDWVMSLSPEWFSTVFGVYLFAGGIVAALGLIELLAWAGLRAGPLRGTVTGEHVGAVGKLLLTFVIFWAYIAYSQYVVIWIADLPIEVGWYVTRTRGGWGTVALIVIAGQFALPFVLLLSRSLKRRPGAMAALGAWLLVMHALDVYWLVLPAFGAAGQGLHWLDPAALLCVGGLSTWFSLSRLAAHATVPGDDPNLIRSARYSAT
jgi:hypothetical protein